MKKKSTLLTAMLCAGGLVAGTAASADMHSDHSSDASMKMGKNVVEVAAGADDFSTLVTAVQAAGLVQPLSDAPAVTIFAPTNEAFAALPDGVLEALLEPENRAILVDILAYHVVPAEVPSSAVAPGKVASLEGADLTIAVDNGTVMVDNAKVIQTDIEGSNGVIHVIDAVILPPGIDPGALVSGNSSSY